MRSGNLYREIFNFGVYARHHGRFGVSGAGGEFESGFAKQT